MRGHASRKWKCELTLGAAAFAKTHRPLRTLSPSLSPALPRTGTKSLAKTLIGQSLRALQMTITAVKQKGRKEERKKEREGKKALCTQTTFSHYCQMCQSIHNVQRLQELERVHHSVSQMLPTKSYQIVRLMTENVKSKESAKTPHRPIKRKNRGQP